MTLTLHGVTQRYMGRNSTDQQSEYEFNRNTFDSLSAVRHIKFNVRPAVLFPHSTHLQAFFKGPESTEITSTLCDLFAAHAVGPSALSQPRAFKTLNRR